MPPIFPKQFDKLIPLLVAGKFIAIIFIALIVWIYFSPKHTDVGYQPEQPINYSHRVHAGELGLDCRYCHVNVDKSPHAGVPPSQICMNCHNNNILKDSEEIKKLQEYHNSGKSIPWERVHNIADYAYFSHEVHINGGVACISCHGRIDEMAKVRQVEPLSMSWCLDCHNNPQIRPPSRVTKMDYPANADEIKELKDYLSNVVVNPHPKEIANLKQFGKIIINPPKQECSACHR